MRDSHTVSHLALAAANTFAAPISAISTPKADKVRADKASRSGWNSGGSGDSNGGSGNYNSGSSLRGGPGSANCDRHPKVKGSNVIFLFGFRDDDGQAAQATSALARRTHCEARRDHSTPDQVRAGICSKSAWQVA